MRSPQILRPRALSKREFLPELGFTMVVEPWYQTGGELKVLISAAHHGQDGPGAGIDFSAQLQALRVVLLPQEVSRLRQAGALAGAAINDVMQVITPGMTENEIATLLSSASHARGGLATVNLIASDQRIAQFRHPLPTDKPVERYVMVVLCLRYMGLIAAVTRFVHFGLLPDELAEKALTVATIDARLIEHTQAGLSLDEMFTFAQETYRQVGYPNAIWQHHQGGSLAYLPREVLMQPGERAVISLNQAFAWNPSVPGAKSEDTIILHADGPEIITSIADWPTIPVFVGDKTIHRPAILLA